MRKMDSLFKLDVMGLNIPEILHYIPAKSTPEHELQLKHVLQQEQRHAHKLSIRTEKPGQFKSPFLPNAEVPKVREFLKSLMGGGYEILLCKGLPTNSIIRGNCVPSLHNNYFEYLAGPGTVRDIDEGGRTPKTLTLPWGHYVPNMGTILAGAFQKVNSHLFPHRFELGHKIIEFTVFSKPVGILQQNTIFWEVRDYGGPPRV